MISYVIKRDACPSTFINNNEAVFTTPTYIFFQKTILSQEPQHKQPFVIKVHRYG